MIRNYFTSALRNFLKHKSFTFLNAIGLSLGLAASLLILQFVKYERSFDRFHSQADDIYRIQYNSYQNGKLSFECAAAVPAVGPALKNNFPEVLRFTRLYPVSGIVTYNSPVRGPIAFREEKMQIADSSVFAVFDFKLLKGNPESVLTGPGKVVITERAAKKYFGGADPVGKTITWDGTRAFEVTGILEDVPANSHIKFDFLFSFATLNRETNYESEKSWGWYDFNTYVLLQPGTNVAALQSKWDSYLKSVRKEEWEKYGFRQEFILQPLTNIHLYSRLLQESQPDEQGDGKSVYALSIIALFILVIAWVNYVNLATAKSFERANEVGVRKVMGAHRGQLLIQFLVESCLVNLVASLLAFALVRLSWPWFSTFSGRSIPISYLYHTEFWTTFAVLFLIGTLFSGFYPALIMSSFKPVTVLKGKLFRSSEGGIMRKSLVVFQFVASVVLISGSLIVYQQLRFMRSQDLGFDMNRTLVIEGPGVVDSLSDKRIEAFKNEVSRIAGVTSVTASSNVPGDEIFWTRGIRRINGGPQSSMTIYNAAIDKEYVPAFGIKILAGRSYDGLHPSDSDAVVINRTAAEALEFRDPATAIGEKVRLGRDTLEIIGVLENYHQMSLKSTVNPMAFMNYPVASFIAIKSEAASMSHLISSIEKPWNEQLPGNPMDYFFLDQFFNRQYDGDLKFGRVCGVFTALAIFIACLGLFGLASFMTVQRTKEIGIRKVLGSSVSGIVFLLSRGFIQLVLIANVLAWPLAWWIMERWLQTFPFHIEINPLWMILAGTTVVAIAFLSVGFQTWKAATLEPARTLKYE